MLFFFEEREREEFLRLMVDSGVVEWGGVFFIVQGVLVVLVLLVFCAGRGVDLSGCGCLL